jgi:hypothetical protein
MRADSMLPFLHASSQAPNFTHLPHWSAGDAS